jgi:L-phenylalanine/L-methionine N-acetyltransferase
MNYYAYRMLRKCQESDIEAIYEIYFHPEVNPFMNMKKMSLSDFQDYWAKRMLNEQIYVQVDGNNVVGMICTKREENRCAGTATISSFAIHPDYQGQHLGAQALAEAVSILQNQGVTRVQLIVEEDNSNARAFYKHQCFEEEGVLRNYFNREGQIVNEIIMAKLLN